MAKKTRGYANSRDVLPETLLREVQKHWEGLLWVPPKEERRGKRDVARNLQIVEEHRKGRDIPALADQHHLTPARIRQILRAHRGRTSR